MWITRLRPSPISKSSCRNWKTKETAYDIHAIYPERRFVAPKVKRMIEFIAEKLVDK